MLRRVIFVCRMMIGTAARWPVATWLAFWLGKRSAISLDGVDLKLRDASYTSKIADLAMAWEVIVDKVYDAYPIAAGDVVLDVGGHIGSFAARAAKAASAGEVYVCEPFPPTYQLLARNTQGFNNIDVNQLAISDRNGEAALFYSKANPAENSLLRETDHKVTVTLQTLGAFLDAKGISRIDLMKVDCEGAEYDILFSAKDHLDKIQKLVMEIHEPRFFGVDAKYSIEGMIALLEDAGFSVAFKRENRFQGYIFAHR
ncbi:MAG: FkbM family methyltransferase [Pseudomonadota bacterium]